MQNKRWIVGMVCMMLVLATACNRTASVQPTENESQTYSSEGTTAGEDTQETTTVSMGSDEVVIRSTDGLPPVSDELKAFYAEAAALYRQLAYCTFATAEEEYEIEGLRYRKVTDERFDGYNEFREYLGNYFTEEFIDNIILPDGSVGYIEADDGSLYMLENFMVPNPCYCGHVFELVRNEMNHIEFRAIVYYSIIDEEGIPLYQGDVFYTEPEEYILFETAEYDFELIRTDEGFRFNTFSILY